MGPITSQQSHKAGADTVSNPVASLSFRQHHTLSVHICYHLPLPGDGLGRAVLQRNPIRDIVKPPLQMKAADSLCSRLAAFTQGAQQTFPFLPVPSARAAHQRRQEALGSPVLHPQGIFLPCSGKIKEAGTIRP